MSGWMAALDAHLVFVQIYEQPTVEKRYTEYLDNLDPVGPEEEDEETRRVHEEADRVLHSRLRGCPTYAISPEMCDVLEVAARQMTETTLLREDLEYPVSDIGFVWFARPLFRTEVLLWAALSEGVNVWWFHTFDEISVRVGGETRTPKSLRGRWVSIDHLYEFGEEIRPSDDPDDESWGFVPALFALLHQRVAVTREERPERPFARRATRAGVVPQVRVVTLRRPVRRPGEEAGTGAEWDHRWIVNGHWRQQWYPSQARHRSLWISPYVKGPEDRPLVVKHSVFDVMR